MKCPNSALFGEREARRLIVKIFSSNLSLCPGLMFAIVLTVIIAVNDFTGQREYKLKSFFNRRCPRRRRRGFFKPFCPREGKGQGDCKKFAYTKRAEWQPKENGSVFVFAYAYCLGNYATSVLKPIYMIYARIKTSATICRQAQGKFKGSFNL